MKSTFIIGIAGGSCSGKSFIAEKLRVALGDSCRGIVSLDRFYNDLKSLPFQERENRNFDRPEAVDFELLRDQLGRILKGNKVRLPDYDFRTHTRKPQHEWTELPPAGPGQGKGMLILEGLHLFRDSDIRDIMGLKIFIDTRMDICLSRRINRDVKERGRTERSVREVFEKKVVPMYRKFVLPTRKFSDLVIDGAEPYCRNLDKIMAELERKL